MIYLYCIHSNFYLYEEYINILLKNYTFIKYINLHSINEIIKYIYANDLEYLNHIIISDIDEAIINKLNKINILFYLLHTNIVNDNLDYLLNSNIKIITYNHSFLSYFKKYIKDVYYLPTQIEKCNNTNKIIINNENNGLLSESKCYNFIFNKIIIINDIKSLFHNSFLNNYIFNIPYTFIGLISEYILNNYNEIHIKMFNTLNVNNCKKIIKNISDNFFREINETNKFGFIILRHVNSEITDKYWIESYYSIRKIYKNRIIIIDDDSNPKFLTNIETINCIVINSEFKKSGEILPYYYFYKYQFFEKAVIIHDSTFIKKYIDFNKYSNVKFIWHFTHHWDDEDKELKLLKILENKKLMDFYHNKDKWFGCYGVQSVIDLEFLKNIQTKYNIFQLIILINNRDKRTNFERIFGLICMMENNMLLEPSIYGTIHHYIHWGYQYLNYLEDMKNNTENPKNHLDIIKVWSGR